MLAYPSGMAYAGWVGMILLVSLMLLTRYTATIISKILYENPDCRTFTDIGKSSMATNYACLSDVYSSRSTFSSGRKAFGIPGTVFITTVFFMVSNSFDSLAEATSATSNIHNTFGNTPGAYHWIMCFLFGR